MAVIIEETQEVVSGWDFKMRYPNVSFPFESDWDDEMLAPYGAFRIYEDVYPDLQMLETAIPGAIEKREDGKYHQAWIVLPADPEQLIAAITAEYKGQVELYMNNTAVAHGYLNMLEVISYADEPVVAKFQNDGRAFRKWRSLVWEYAQVQIPLIATKQRPKPTAEAFLAELPALALNK
ncbi:hypothetical protein ACQKEN_17180 [Pseudomonas sp. NPDC078416]|uniref:hypothetical protein n=1 Tax=Pseudomonas sp. NPDC078416 TaxID=3390637 RepID=UPI003CFDE180